MTAPTPAPLPPRSCATCPSFLTPQKSMSKFQKSIGSPMCGRFGRVLGKPGMTEQQADKLQTHIGTNCKAFGQPLPGAPLEFNLQVAMPDPEAYDPDKVRDKQDICKTCSSCENFVRDDVVAGELGWATGLCAAKGLLILPNRQVYEARGCGFRNYGTVRTSTTGITLLPEYEDAFNLNVNPIKAYLESVFVEPADYPTDKIVTEQDAASGIRAWRKVPDPAGSGNFGHLPCYDPNFFSEEEQKKIPRTGDDEHPELYIDHFGGTYLATVAWTELDETPALWGVAGIGKTELFRYLAWLMCLPFERISITRQTDVDDLMGVTHFSPEDGTYFQYGRLPRAWSKPCVICIDEPNCGPPEVWQAIRPLTDNSKQMVLEMNGGEIRDRHADCYMGMAMNPPWDAKNVGAEQIGDADANRLFHVYLDMPPEILEREIITKRIELDGWKIDDKRLDMIMAIAAELRGLIADETLPISWAIRPQIKVARATRWFDTITAYRRAIGDFLEPEAAQILLDTVRAHLKETS